MRVIEAVKQWETVMGREVEIEGVAEIAQALSVIYEVRRQGKMGDPITPGILIHGDYFKQLVESLPVGLSAYGGSEIQYIVEVRIHGILANTGHTFAPLKFGHIYEVEFRDEHAGVQTVVVNSRLKEVVFRLNRNLKASEVKKLEPYFDAFENLIALKKYLESGAEITLIRRVPETDLSPYLKLLRDIDAIIETRYSPIGNVLDGKP